MLTLRRFAFFVCFAFKKIVSIIFDEVLNTAFIRLVQGLINFAALALVFPVGTIK